MDVERVRAVSGIPAAVGLARGVQRQVHVQSARAARRVVCDTGVAPAPELPEFLLSGFALAVLRDSSGQGSVRHVMSRSTAAVVSLRDYHPQQESMRDTILEGLRLPQKT